MTREEAIKILMSANVWNNEEWMAWETLIPELAESEDERIMSRIIDGFKNFSRSASKWNNIPVEEVIAYLEKQKEQKPELPKPHKGDDTNPYDMSVSEAQEYAIKRGFGVPFNDGEVYVDERHITQTIGNILRWADEHLKEQKPDSLTKYVYSKEDKKFIQDCANILVANDYVTSAERLLSMFEQKPIDYETELKKCKDNPLYFYDKYVSIKQKPAECIKATINDEPIPIENQSVDIPLIEWNEEDERMLSRCIKSIEISKQFADSDTFKVAKDKEIDWLENRIKSFRPVKQEWSEEDEKTINDACCFLGEYAGYIGSKNWGKSSMLFSIVDKLKSLRPQYYGDVTMTEAYKMGLEAGKASSWKPSNEQLKYLLMLADYFESEGGTSNAKTLREFHEQLEKL